MAEFVTIPVFIKEEPLEDDCNEEERNNDFHTASAECTAAPIPDSSKREESTTEISCIPLLNCRSEEDKPEDPDKSLHNTEKEDQDDPLADEEEKQNAGICTDLVLHSNTSDADCNSTVTESAERSNIELLCSQIDSDYDEESDVSESSYPAFKVEAELGNSSDASSEAADDRISKKDNLPYNLRRNDKPKNSRTRTRRKEDDMEKPFECPICHKWFRTSSAMNGHVAKRHKTTLGEKFICHICGAPGSTRASLKRHLIRTHKISKVDHPELLTKKCFHCGIGFASHLLLYDHIKTEHTDQLDSYHHCRWCPALMRVKASLVRHVRRAHPGKEAFFSTTVTCTVCNIDLANIPMLQRHMNKEHPDDNRHKCTTCDAAFKYPYMLSRHQVIHEDPDKYKEYRKKRKYSVNCETCDRKFDSKSRLISHIRNVHTQPPQIKIYTCRLCGMSFPTAKQNNRHYRRIHRPERQKIHCGKCNITFNTRQECDEHRAIHPSTCEVCQKQFLKRDSLREHLLIHSAPRHECPHCDKKFTQRSNLKRHIRVHTGEKPYRCSYCSRSFSDKSACNSHSRVHTGYERSVCSICGASFSKKQRLNYHMRIHSGKGLLHCPLCMRSCTTSYSLRKHIESHQVPLTKALKSLGFGPLLLSDPSFIANAIRAVTHATLRETCKEDETKEELDSSLNSFSSSSSLSPITSSPNKNNESNIDELKLPLLDLLLKREKEEEEEEEEDSAEEHDAELNIKPDPDSFHAEDSYENDSVSATHFDLTKFLQSVLDKENTQLQTKRRLRKRKGSINYDDEIYCQNEDEYDDYSACSMTELPDTVDEELVQQCLEIVMKDEQRSIEEDLSCVNESSDSGEHLGDDDCDDNINKGRSPSDMESRESEGNQDPLTFNVDNIKKEIGDEDETDKIFKSCQGIPKLKISRLSGEDTTDSSKNLFIAEII